ncbi:hypothetical protein GQ53DRAFT_239126 [Thozetella sp. PMI_491]|nr:hypothetical protein GQ53DRAFT_239126 [Thozetella sp. PMI_491]
MSLRDDSADSSGLGAGFALGAGLALGVGFALGAGLALDVGFALGAGLALGAGFAFFLGGSSSDSSKSSSLDISSSLASSESSSDSGARLFLVCRFGLAGLSTSAEALCLDFKGRLFCDLFPFFGVGVGDGAGGAWGDLGASFSSAS